MMGLTIGYCSRTIDYCSLLFSGNFCGKGCDGGVQSRDMGTPIPPTRKKNGPFTTESIVSQPIDC